MKLFSRYCVENDGTGRVEIPNGAQIQVKPAFGFFVQFKMDEAGVVMRKQGEYLLEVLSNGNVKITLGNNANLSSSGLNVLGKWVAVFVNVKFSTGELVMYVDEISNKFTGSSGSAFNGTTNPLWLLYNGTNGSVGRVDRLMFFGNFVSEENVAKLFMREIAWTDLDCFFPIDEGKGDKVYDVVTVGYKGIVYGCKWGWGRDMERIINEGGKVVLVKKM